MPTEQDKHLGREDEAPKKDRSREQAEQGGSAEGGEIKDKEAETSNSYGNTRDSGERPK